MTCDTYWFLMHTVSLWQKSCLTLNSVQAPDLCKNGSLEHDLCWRLKINSNAVALTCHTISQCSLLPHFEILSVYSLLYSVSSWLTGHYCHYTPLPVYLWSLTVLSLNTDNWTFDWCVWSLTPDPTRSKAQAHIKPVTTWHSKHHSYDFFLISTPHKITLHLYIVGQI